MGNGYLSVAVAQLCPVANGQSKVARSRLCSCFLGLVPQRYAMVNANTPRRCLTYDDFSVSGHGGDGVSVGG